MFTRAPTSSAEAHGTSNTTLYNKKTLDRSKHLTEIFDSSVKQENINKQKNKNKSYLKI